MTFQTPDYHEENRAETKKTNLENEIRSSWLGIECLVKTFNRDEEGENLAQEIQEMRELSKE